MDLIDERAPMKLFDLHCDTVTELRKRGETLLRNTCHVRQEEALRAFDDYTQVFAFWSEDDLEGEDNYRLFYETLRYVQPMLVETARFHPILAVEGGKLLCHDLSRLDALYACGVRILTLVWKDVCCVGGAYNTDIGLTSFGRQVVERCYDLGIVPDLSHASDTMVYEVLAIAERRGGTVMASHSCARALCPHARNLTDDMAKRIADLGGLIGVNLVTEHLGGESVEDVCRHLWHMAKVAGEEHVCLGCDLDGTASLPRGISHVGDLTKIAAFLRKNLHPDGFAEKVFYSNAQTFAKAHFI